MSDPETLAAYDRDASAFADEWHAQPPPSDMQAVLRRFFRPGETADIGCGSGRDTAWLSRNGFPAVGLDASDGLIREARRRYPAIAFERSDLPDLAGIAERRFVNVLCETVIMHLAPALVAPAVRRLLAILETGGTLYLSWRVTEGESRRDDQGRLYAAFDPALVTSELGETETLLDQDVTSASSGRRIRRIVARKASA